MKKKILLLMTVLASFTVSQATEGYWVDVNFTRDSTMWIEALPELSVVNLNLQTAVDGDYLGFNVNGAFGRFAGAKYSYTPLNVENEEERFIYALRMHNNDDSHFTFPEIENAGKIKVHFLCGNASLNAEVTLQKLVGEEWVEFDPEIKFDVPPHDNSTTSFVLEKDLNITDSVKLRLKGPTLRNVHIYSVSISKVTTTGINTPDINKIKVYPVPASNHLTVSGLSGTASELQIVNVTGQTVKTIISSGAETPIDITDLQPGYYFIRAENRTLKFIKQ